MPSFPLSPSPKPSLHTASRNRPNVHPAQLHEACANANKYKEPFSCVVVRTQSEQVPPRAHTRPLRRIC
eukprot:3643087-Pleurochrysis_carterae.AAC.2